MVLRRRLAVALSLLALAAGGCRADDHAYKVPAPDHPQHNAKERAVHATRVPHQLPRRRHVPGRQACSGCLIRS